jgi:hypothetical protein
VFDAQAERGDLGAADIDAGGAFEACRRDSVAGQQVDHRLFDAIDQAAHRKFAPAQVEQQVGDDLAGAVIGDLAAAIDLHHRDADVLEQMLRLARQALREYRRMFAEPEFVGSVGVACSGELLHRGEGRRVVDAAQPSDDHSTTFTIGCAVSSR